MNRRELIGAGLKTVAIGRVLRPGGLFAQTSATISAVSGDTIYLNPETGSDEHSGAKSSPLRTLGEAGRRVAQSTGTRPLTVILSSGIYAVGESLLLKPQKRSFTASNRLTIRAEFLPDDPEWTQAGMPTLIPTLPFPNPPTWNGRPDGGGGAVDEILVETSHVSLLGLKFMGLPVVETPKTGMIRRIYVINRSSRDFEDLEIGHCIFASDMVTNPMHVAVIANGDGMNVHHCIFWGTKITVVYWQGGSKGHAMQNCLIRGAYGSGIWTAGIMADFQYQNNVVDDCNYAWTYQNSEPAPPFYYNPDATQSDIPIPPRVPPSSPSPAVVAGGPPNENLRRIVPLGERIHYKVTNCYFGRNRTLAGSGTGQSLGYVDTDSNFMDMVGTKVSNQPVLIERNQTKRNYLHPIAGSDAAKMGAGLFVNFVG
jgi:hypothetical protein